LFTCDKFFPKCKKKNCLPTLPLKRFHIVLFLRYPTCHITKWSHCWFHSFPLMSEMFLLAIKYLHWVRCCAIFDYMPCPSNKFCWQSLLKRNVYLRFSVYSGSLNHNIYISIFVTKLLSQFETKLSNSMNVHCWTNGKPILQLLSDAEFTRKSFLIHFS
jgi:hypothetical protein